MVARLSNMTVFQQLPRLYNVQVGQVLRTIGVDQDAVMSGTAVTCVRVLYILPCLADMPNNPNNVTVRKSMFTMPFSDLAQLQ